MGTPLLCDIYSISTSFFLSDMIVPRGSTMRELYSRHWVTLKMLIWRVRPGVLETFATDSPKSVLSILLLPTLERPRKAISGKFVLNAKQHQDHHQRGDHQQHAPQQAQQEQQQYQSMHGSRKQQQAAQGHHHHHQQRQQEQTTRGSDEHQPTTQHQASRQHTGTAIKLGLRMRRCRL